MIKKVRNRILSLKSLLIAFCVIVVLVLLFIIQTIVEYPLEKITMAKAQSRILVNRGPLVLEEGSLVNADHLKTYFLFSGNKHSFDSWVDKQVQAGSIEFQGPKNIHINHDITIEGLLRNDCDDIYCYQHKKSLDDTPSVFWKGLMGVEDQRFLQHFGIDLKSIFRAIIIDLKEMRLAQGGSTLTQQLVKNIFFSSKKSLGRKFKEMIYSIYIEQVLSKEEIIEAYFNEVFWGSFQGIKIKGLYAASLFYFGKKFYNLSSFESVILISLLKGPYYYGPIKNIERLQERSKLVYEKLVDAGIISKEISPMWNDKQWQAWRRGLIANESTQFLHHIVQIPRRENSIFNDFESFVFEQSVADILKSAQKSVPKKLDFAVKAYIFDFSKEYPYLYYSKQERDKEVALMKEKHQVGSILKPVFYGVYTELGKKFDDMVDTAPLTLKLKSGDWTPKEAGKVEFENVTLASALQKSLNIPVIRIASELGFDQVERKAIEFFPQLQRPLSEYPAQILGSVELTLSEIVEGYKKFIISECQKRSDLVGNKEDQDQTQDHFDTLSVLSNPQLTTIHHRLNDILASHRFFGKTGTSNWGLDNLFTFFDGKLLGVIWFGQESNRENKSLGLSGSQTSYMIFQNFMTMRGRRLNQMNCELVIPETTQVQSSAIDKN